jgi:hypothetical protein
LILEIHTELQIRNLAPHALSKDLNPIMFFVEPHSGPEVNSNTKLSQAVLMLQIPTSAI